MAITPEILAIVERALAEDIGTGDITTDSIVPPETHVAAQIVAKTSGVIAGLEIADRKSTRLNSSHLVISYAVFCLKKKKINTNYHARDYQRLVAAFRTTISASFEPTCTSSTTPTRTSSWRCSPSQSHTATTQCSVI